MNNDLILLAAKACQRAYKKNIDLGSMEYALTIEDYHGVPFQILAMPGSNEFLDWVWNFTLLSWDGVKLCSYLAVKRIWQAVKNDIDPTMPLLVVGHSKAGPDALRWKQKYGADFCVALCPPPAFRPWKKVNLKDTAIVIDPDDVVPLAGTLSFNHPTTDTLVHLPREKARYDPSRIGSDHVIDHIVQYFQGKVNLSKLEG